MEVIRELIELVLSYVAIWAPSLIAIMSIAATIIGAYGKVRKAVAETKLATEELKKNETIKELKTEFNKQAATNEELIRTNKLLLEQITKIKDYADLKKE